MTIEQEIALEKVNEIPGKYEKQTLEELEDEAIREVLHSIIAAPDGSVLEGYNTFRDGIEYRRMKKADVEARAKYAEATADDE